jgi:very-short-patch-repair endonuclease
MNHFAKSDGPVSKAEYTIFGELSRRDLTHGMTTQDTVILRLTIPDFLWRERKKALYIDGCFVHSSDKAIKNDTEIDELMEYKGWSVLRLKYEPPLTKTALADMMGKIERFLGEK